MPKWNSPEKSFSLHAKLFTKYIKKQKIRDQLKLSAGKQKVKENRNAHKTDAIRCIRKKYTSFGPSWKSAISPPASKSYKIKTLTHSRLTFLLFSALSNFPTCIRHFSKLTQRKRKYNKNPTLWRINQMDLVAVGENKELPATKATSLNVFNSWWTQKVNKKEYYLD